MILASVGVTLGGHPPACVQSGDRPTPCSTTLKDGFTLVGSRDRPQSKGLTREDLRSRLGRCWRGEGTCKYWSEEPRLERDRVALRSEDWSFEDVFRLEDEE